MPCQSQCTGPSRVAVERCELQIARERRLRKASEQAAEAAADGVDAERQRQAARAAQEAAFLHLKVHSLPLSVNTEPAQSNATTTWLQQFGLPQGMLSSWSRTHAKAVVAATEKPVCLHVRVVHCVSMLQLPQDQNWYTWLYRNAASSG